MRVAPCLVMIALFVGLAGCSTLGKRQPASPGPATRPPVQPSSGPAPARAGAQPPSGIGGILAGQVLDSSSGRPAGTYIQVADLGGGAAAPIEVAADNQGYFTIQGLQPGRNYQLTARTRSGDRLLAGVTVATPPNARVLIRLSEGFAMPGTPALPAAPGFQQPSNPAPVPPPPSWPDPSAADKDQAWAPGRNVPYDPAPSPLGAGPFNPPRRPAELGPPVGISPPGVPQAPMFQPQPRVEVRPQSIAQEQVTRNDVPASIPGPGFRPPQASGPGPDTSHDVAPRNPLPAPGPSGWAPAPSLSDQLLGPTKVPSCVLTGQKLQNLALNDISGQPWEFSQRHGRLVLIDFWGSWCIHCLHAIPHLKDMQLRYGPYGLEVIGIAYEEGTPLEKMQKVERIRTRYAINYRLLMGADRAQCPVRTQFQVRNWPTMVLLDDQGQILWRGEGLDQEQMRELDIIIRQRLGLR